MLGALFCVFLFLSSTVWAQTKEEYVHLGNVIGRQGNYKEAVLDYTKAIGSDSSYANAYYNRGYAYIELRKYKLALSDLDKAIELNPKYAAAYHVRGIAYFSRKKYNQAISEYSKAIELDPTNIKFYISRMSTNFKLGYKDRVWKDVIKIQSLGGTVNPLIINMLKDKKYRE